MLKLLSRATCYHGAFPHFMNGRTGATNPFHPQGRWRRSGRDRLPDDGTPVRQGIFRPRHPRGIQDQRFDQLHLERRRMGLVYPRDTLVLQWHWSPNNGWAQELDIRGWNECLVTYSARRLRAPATQSIHAFITRASPWDVISSTASSYYGVTLPLGPPFGRPPVFYPQYSFCGIDPRGLKDQYADYWQQKRSTMFGSITRTVPRIHCCHKGYGASLLGFSH